MEAYFFDTANGAGDILAPAAVPEVSFSSPGTGGNSGGFSADGSQGMGTGFWPSGNDDSRGQWHWQQLLEVLAWRALTEVLLALQMVLVELLALPAVPELFAAGVGNGGIGADGEVAMDVLADYSWEWRPSNSEKYQNLNHL